jgi:tetratricopeptide (TPR) repeat protein
MSSAPASQDRLGHYLRDVVLGQGGMGTVFSARDLRTGQRVAVKTLHPGRSSPVDLVRFKREFRAAARLTHPHCLPVFELDQTPKGQWFYAMEFAAGGHLRSDRQRPWQEIVQIGLQVLAALDQIHGKRIVHRDIKPQNILIHAQAEGTAPWVKLADFGISKVVDLDDEVGAVLGSLGYLAPEQLEGWADPRTDLYALGLVLYEAIAGGHPFAEPIVKADTANLRDLRAWRRRYEVAFRPLRELAEGVPPAVAAVIMAMLQPRPQDRPATAAVVFEALAAQVPPAQAGAAGPLPPLSQTPYLSQATMVGRSDEAQRLQLFSASVIRGLSGDDPVVLFVTGAAGTGKSRLLRELLRTADERDIRVENGVWRDGAGTWALSSLLAALPVAPSAPVSPRTTAQAVDSTIGWPAAVALAAPEDPQGRYHQLGQALLDLASRKPLLVLLEDAHWADPTSLELLAFLIRRVASSRESRPQVGFVITHRPSDRPEVAALYRGAVNHAAAALLTLGDLGPEETVDLVGSLLSSARTAVVEQLGRRLHASSQGNPLLLGQTLQLLLTDGKLSRQGEDWHFNLGDPQVASLPQSLQEAVGDRAARLSLDTKKVLAAAAVIGREVPFEILHHASQMDGLLLLDCLDEALRAEFLTEHPGRPSVFQFVHDRVRDAIVSRLAGKERIDLHRRTASALEMRRQADPAVEADLGYHLRAAGELAAAEAAYTRAGQRAADAHAQARAADLFAEALAVAADRGATPPEALVEQHAEACLQCGRYQAALLGYHQRLLTVTEPLQRAQLLHRCAEAEWRRGNTAASGEQMENVLRALNFPVPRGQVSCIRGWATGLAKVSILVSGPSKGVAASVSSGEERERQIAAICLRLSEVYYYSDMHRCLYYTVHGFLRARHISDQSLRCEAYSQEAYSLAVLSFEQLSRRLLDPARAMAVPLSGADQAWNRLLHGMCLGVFGDAHGYAAHLKEADTLLAGSAEPMKQRQVWALLGESLLVLGQVQEADGYGKKVLKLSTEVGDERGRGWGLYVCGWAAARRGDLERGRALLSQAAIAAERGGDPVFRCCAQGRGAFAALMAGDLDEALSLSQRSASEMVTRSLRHPTTANDGIFLAAAGAVQGRDGSLPREVRRLVASRRLLGRELARAMRLSAPLFWAGNAAWAHSQGHDGRARRYFARAVAIAEKRGLEGELHDVHALAARVLGGGRSGRIATH